MENGVSNFPKIKTPFSMQPLVDFPWPLISGQAQRPVWDGHKFHTDGQVMRVLVYDTEQSHWSEDLTSLHENEAGSQHPIDVASRRLAVASMKLIQRNVPVILDVGCSSGFVLDELRAGLPLAGLIGADYLRGPLETLGKRIFDIPIMQFDLRKCPLPAGCVDGITCLNVLEHIDDHEQALNELFRILADDGIAHVEVPAGPHLYDIYDEHLMHYRRYQLKDLVSLAKKIGFSVLKATHLGFAVYPAFWWTKMRNRRKLKIAAEEKARLVAQLIRKTRSSLPMNVLMNLETSIGRFVSYPWGIRCVVTLSKKSL